ncbi:type II toxin-antitoxin system VapC family toxin [Deferrisoma camini]|uniref:type II toxin-antitoxin system VapC family toxin n=1 Tax=Deferrisoma camini TaxID=1035120 RepID=UPI00046CF5F5|nr:type II toxin-antitoxin system VapC family toxin [Deferrisoma camini]
MILYCDTSALVKRYVREAHTEAVLAAWRDAVQVASSEVACAECLAALARRRRAGDLGERDHERVRSRFLDDFRAMVRVPVGDAVNRLVARLVLEHPLRGFDAIHLASALLIKEHVRGKVVFACYDQVLAQSARAVGLRVLE